MPYATAQDATRLYFEEAGKGTPILFVHEFAADYASWEPQMRYFSRRHRCIAYSARGYTPSDVPAANRFTYENFRDDALAVTRSSRDRASAFRRAVHGGLLVASSRLEQSGARRVVDARRCRHRFRAGADGGVSRKRANAMLATSRRSALPRSRKCTQDRRIEFHSRSKIRVASRNLLTRWRATMRRGSAHTQRGFQGSRPSVYTFEEDLKRMAVPTPIVCGDEDDACLQPSIFLKQNIPASGPFDVSENWPHSQSRRAWAI